MDTFIRNIPPVNCTLLQYILEVIKYQHKENTLWLEFGVNSGSTINYISNFTKYNVYGFDCFTGLPEKWMDGYEKGAFNRGGVPPNVNNNVELIVGLFQDTLENFIQNKNMKISFIHMDADLYSSTKYVLDILKDYLDRDCVIVFDELVGYPGYDGETGELKAFYEFVNENNINFEWIGKCGQVVGVKVNIYTLEDLKPHLSEK